MSRDRQLYIPQPAPARDYGRSALGILANNQYEQVATPAPAAAHDGSVVEPFLFTPRYSGKLLVSADVAGECSIEMSVQFTVTIGAQTFIFNPRSAGSSLFILNMSRTLIASGFVVGTPLTIRYDWTCLAGPGETFEPLDGQGGVTVLELN
jgi:hypothetical protein